MQDAIDGKIKPSDVTEDTDNTEETILDKTEIVSNLLSLYGQNLSNDEYLSGKVTFYYYDTATDEDDVVTHTEIDLDIDFEKTPDVMHMEGAVSLASSLITISVEYENGIPKRIDTVLISTQHSEKVSSEDIKQDMTTTLENRWYKRHIMMLMTKR